MSVSNLVAAGIYAKLRAAGAVQGTYIYRNQATEGAALPYIVFSLQAGGPLNETPSDLRDEVMFVRAYADTAGQAGSLDAAVSGVLHGGSIAVTGYTVYQLRREMDLELVENLQNGRQVFMCGGTYRICLDG